MSPYVEALRPRQWTKNLIVFSAPLFAFQLDARTLIFAGAAFAALSLTASGFYLINDVVDRSADVRHPVKRRRPVASGRVGVPAAIVLGVLLLAAGLIGARLVSDLLGVVVLSYALLQGAYNAGLKRAVLLDVMVIAAGFVLRALAGAAAGGLPVSPWFLICTALLALFLAVEKRKAELRAMGDGSVETRPVLRRYSLALLGRMENIVATGAVITYVIWASGPQVRGAPTSWMLATIPFVLYGVFRYQLISAPADDEGQEERGERPEEVLLSDLPILVTTAGWAATSLLILWWQHRG